MIYLGFLCYVRCGGAVGGGYSQGGEDTSTLLPFEKLGSVEEIHMPPAVEAGGRYTAAPPSNSNRGPGD